MAHLLGECPSWLALRAAAHRLDPRLPAHDLDQLAAAVHARRAGLVQRARELPGEVLRELALRLAELDRQLVELARLHAQQDARAQAAAAAEAARRAALLAPERGRLLRWWRRLRARALERERLRREAARQRDQDEARRELQQGRVLLARRQADPAGDVQQRLAAEQAQQQQLEDLLRSPLAAAAAREQAVALALEPLPDEFAVLHGLRLQSNSFVAPQPSALREARADHVVVGPTGVFVLAAMAPGEPLRAGLVAAARLCALLLQSAHLPHAVQAVAVGAEDLAGAGDALCQLPADLLEGYLVRRLPERALLPHEVRVIADFLAHYLTRRGPRAWEPAA